MNKRKLLNFAFIYFIYKLYDLIKYLFIHEIEL